MMSKSISARMPRQPNFLKTSARGWQASAEITFKQSTTPSIYVPDQLDAEIGLESFQAAKNDLFRGLTARYIPPSEFKYALPKSGVPEFAFVGRSNVGKSSLISKLIGDSKLVRVSKTPGCTQSVNYYALEKPGSKVASMYLVDLPGYGFSKVSKEEHVKWSSMIQGYLRSRDQSILRRTYILVDGRHGSKVSDHDMMLVLDACRLPYQFIVTKNDVTGQAELEATLKSIFVEALAKKMRSCLPLVHVSSSKSNYGIDELMLAMAEIMSHRWAKPSVHSVPASDSISTSMASSQSTSKSAVTQAPRSMPSPTTKKTSY